MFSPDFALRHQAHSGRQIVIANPPRDASKVLESAHMPVKEALLLLAGEGHHKASPTVGQPHHKHLHRLLHSADDGHSLSPIGLGVLTRVKREWQEKCWGGMVLVPLGHVQAHACFTALVALRLQDLIDFVAGVLLLLRQARIFGQQRVCALTIRSRILGTASTESADRAAVADCRPLYPPFSENGCARGQSAFYFCLPGIPFLVIACSAGPQISFATLRDWPPYVILKEGGPGLL